MSYEEAEAMLSDLCDKVYDTALIGVAGKLEASLKKSVAEAAEKAIGTDFEQKIKEVFIAEFNRKYVETVEEVAGVMAVKIANATTDPNKIKCYQDKHGQVHVDLSELLSSAKPIIKINSV